jgi:multidrug efflux pump subunit AcrA (membrane-fusion protein)
MADADPIVASETPTAPSHRAQLRRRRQRRRLVLVGIGVAVVAGGSGAAMAATGDNGPHRRTATVTTATVTQTIESSGVVTSSVRVTPSFPQSGTVATVDVAIGDAVRKGQRLATLDTTSLQTTLDSAKATLATAQQRLQADETGQTSTGQSATTQSATTQSATTQSATTQSATTRKAATTAVLVSYVEQRTSAPSAGGTSTDLTALVGAVTAAQQAVVSAQHQLDDGQRAVDAARQTVDADVAQNKALRDAQSAACPSVANTTVSADCVTAMAAYQASADTLASDMTALDATLTAQDTTVHSLDQDITALDAAVSRLAAAIKAGTGGTGTNSGTPGSTTKTTGRTSGTSNSGTSNSGTNNSGTNNSGTNSAAGNGSAASSSTSTGTGTTALQPASAAQIAADQSAIDAAQAEVGVAEQNVAAATLTSPVDGVVAAVGLTAGTSSAGQSITVLGTGLQGVVVAIPLTEIDQVKVGQPATVTVDGRTTPLRASVQAIGVVSTTSGGRTTFPVTVQFAVGTPHVYDGTGADVEITTGAASGVLTVPISAIHTTANGRHTVTVANGSTTTTVAVTLGMVGNDVAQVTAGLRAGQRVVLADLGQALPSSTTATAGTFRVGQFGVGGFVGSGRTGTTRTGG